MNNLLFSQKVKLIFLYTLPILLACLYVMINFHDRIDKLGEHIKPACELQYDSNGDVNACIRVKDIDCEEEEREHFAAIAENKNNRSVFKSTNDYKICQYREIQERHINITNDSQEENEPYSRPLFALSLDNNTHQLLKACHETGSKDLCLTAQVYRDVDEKLFSILAANGLTVFAMVLLPFVLMAEFLAKSNRINLEYDRRMKASTNNWWLKLILGVIMAIGWVYIINPLGRGSSTIYQFFIAAGLEAEDSLPIFIKTKAMTPVIAGFFGWYLHLIGYVFTKVIHHDVISGRVYNLLFKKFIIVYGLALVLPAAGIVDNEKSYAFYMFLIGLFPLTTMSMLLEAASKIGSSGNKGNANLSLLPGISRWQILRLEEEGVDSMASLANIRIQTIHENLQFIEKLTMYWVDIARLYTIVGHEGYENLKNSCRTASEFIDRADDPEFIETVDNIEGVGTTKEISRLLASTFTPLHEQ